MAFVHKRILPLYLRCGVLVIVYWLLCIGYCECIMLCYVILSNWCIVRMCRVL